jgi:hypothetical protein
MKNKTHVPDLSTTGRQYHNRQLALRFCAILGAGTSVGSSTRTSVGSSAGSSAGKKHGVFFPVIAEKHELTLGSIKT